MPWIVRDHARICRGCWDQMSVPIPIRFPCRIFGITQSKMNPNICTICERAFRRVKKRRHVSATATILFADIRGYTSLPKRMNPIELSDMISAFRDQCAQGIWEHDGIVNKQMGDGLMAIFNFPIKIERHAEAAVRAALEIQQRCGAALAELAASRGDTAEEGLGVGIGVHTGQVEIGEFSTAPQRFPTIGGTVNLTARLERAGTPARMLKGMEQRRLVDIVRED
jgi:adenylate cyclase